MGLFNRMKDPVEGMATVVSSTGPPDHATSANCRMNLVVQAEGVPPTSVNVKGMIVPVKKWPFPGMVIPVQVDRANPQNVKILFDKIQSHAESSKASADALAAMMRGETPATGEQADWAAAGIPPDKADIVAQIQQMFPGARIQVAGSSSVMPPPNAGGAAGWGPPTAASAASAADETDDRLEALERLARLHESGALTDAEFAAEKRRILDS